MNDSLEGLVIEAEFRENPVVVRLELPRYLAKDIRLMCGELCYKTTTHPVAAESNRRAFLLELARVLANYC
jgi:hypothetical protein